MYHTQIEKSQTPFGGGILQKERIGISQQRFISSLTDFN